MFCLPEDTEWDGPYEAKGAYPAEFPVYSVFHSTSISQDSVQDSVHNGIDNLTRDQSEREVLQYGLDDSGGAMWFQLRRVAFRLLTNRSPSTISRSRPISNLTYPTLRAPRHSSVAFSQRRWVSDEVEKKEDIPLEKSEPAPEDEVENAISEQQGEPASEPQKPAEEPKSTIEAAKDTVTKTISQAVDGAKTLAEGDDATAAPNKDTIYIGNLFFDVNEADLKSEFSRFGDIRYVKIIRDSRGLSKGYGYVAFTNPEDAAKTKDAMHMQVYEGRRVIVQFAQRDMGKFNASPSRTLNPPTKTLFIGNMSFEMTDRDLNDLFKGIKNLVDVRVAIDRRTGQPRGFAHADFIDVNSAIEAQKLLVGKSVHGRTLRIDYSQTPNERKSLPGSGGSQAAGGESYSSPS